MQNSNSKFKKKTNIISRNNNTSMNMFLLALSPYDFKLASTTNQGRCCSNPTPHTNLYL